MQSESAVLRHVPIPPVPGSQSARSYRVPTATTTFVSTSLASPRDGMSGSVMRNTTPPRNASPKFGSPSRDDGLPPTAFQASDKVWATNQLVVRVEEGLDSPIVGNVASGTLVQLGPERSTIYIEGEQVPRARMIAPLQGWISLAYTQPAPVLVKNSLVSPQQSSVVRRAQSAQSPRRGPLPRPEIGDRTPSPSREAVVRTVDAPALRGSPSNMSSKDGGALGESAASLRSKASDSMKPLQEGNFVTAEDLAATLAEMHERITEEAQAREALEAEVGQLRTALGAQESYTTSTSGTAEKAAEEMAGIRKDYSRTVETVMAIGKELKSMATAMEELRALCNENRARSGKVEDGLFKVQEDLAGTFGHVPNQLTQLIAATGELEAGQQELRDALAAIHDNCVSKQIFAGTYNDLHHAVAKIAADAAESDAILSTLRQEVVGWQSALGTIRERLWSLAVARGAEAANLAILIDEMHRSSANSEALAESLKKSVSSAFSFTERVDQDTRLAVQDMYGKIEECARLSRELASGQSSTPALDVHERESAIETVVESKITSFQEEFQGTVVQSCREMRDEILAVVNDRVGKGKGVDRDFVEAKTEELWRRLEEHVNAERSFFSEELQQLAGYLGDKVENIEKEVRSTGRG
mmetsp:Transcript_41776/g.110097  ORF Transcript_41776/g.110097 Transcript_41776/m.110097 type:complete len:643 (-) Transcript_41776:42-1970(-)